jgi:pimeloyl-ACP methyl ester carboxylesterase
VVLVHGMGASHKDSSYTRRVAEALEGQGFAVLRFNFSLRGLAQTMRADTFSRHERELSAVLDHLPRLKGIDASRVGLLGTSLGANVALEVGSRHPRVGAIAAVGAFDLAYVARNHKRIIAALVARLPGLVPEGVRAGETFLRAARRRDKRHLIDSLRKPVLFLHGTADRTAPRPLTRAFYEEVAPTAKAWRDIPGADHAYRDPPGKTKITDAISRHAGAWFKRWLQ